MTPDRRPLSVTILAFVYIAIGSVGFVYHLLPFLASHVFRQEDVWIELVELLAVCCGIFLLRGRNWARWLAVAWIAFHVVLSAFHALGEFVIHLVFCIAIAWVLFRRPAAQYFSRAPLRNSSLP